MAGSIHEASEGRRPGDPRKDFGTREFSEPFGFTMELVRGKKTEILEMLGRHSDVIGTEVAITVANRESAKALREFGREVMQLHTNTDANTFPGMTIFVTPDALNRVVSLCETLQRPVPEEQMEEIVPGLIAIDFPKGIYAVAESGRRLFQFYQEADDPDDSILNNKTNKAFALMGDAGVVRIEGRASDEFWQNPNFEFDGTPKQDHQA